MTALGPLKYSVSGGSEIDILESYNNHCFERVIGAIAYARDRASTYSPSELERLSKALSIIKWDYRLIDLSIHGTPRMDNPGPLASSLLYDISNSKK